MRVDQPAGGAAPGPAVLVHQSVDEPVAVGGIERPDGTVRLSRHREGGRPAEGQREKPRTETRRPSQDHQPPVTMNGIEVVRSWPWRPATSRYSPGARPLASSWSTSCVESGLAPWPREMKEIVGPSTC